MPLTYRNLAEMQAAMLDRQDLLVVEVRLSGENIASLQQDFLYGSPLAIRYMPLPRNTVEFFVPQLQRLLSTWQDYHAFHGGGSVVDSPSIREFPIETERTFYFDGETFICRLTPEPIPAEPAQLLRSIQLPEVPSIEPQLRAISAALETQVMPHANLAAEAMRRLSTAVQDRIVKDIITGYDPRYSMGGPPPKPKPQNRIDFLLEAIDDGVDEPHAED